LQTFNSSNVIVLKTNKSGMRVGHFCVCKNKRLIKFVCVGNTCFTLLQIVNGGCDYRRTAWRTVA